MTSSAMAAGETVTSGQSVANRIPAIQRPLHKALQQGIDAASGCRLTNRSGPVPGAQSGPRRLWERWFGKHQQRFDQRKQQHGNHDDRQRLPDLAEPCRV